MTSTAFSGARAAPWLLGRGVDAVIRRWVEAPQVKASLVLDEVLPGAVAESVPLPLGLSEPVRKALARRGVTSLYTHQAEAFELAAGRARRGGGHSHRVGQEPLLQPAGARRAGAEARRPRALPVSHQGAVPRPGGGAARA